MSRRASSADVGHARFGQDVGVQRSKDKVHQVWLKKVVPTAWPWTRSVSTDARARRMARPKKQNLIKKKPHSEVLEDWCRIGLHRLRLHGLLEWISEQSMLDSLP